MARVRIEPDFEAANLDMIGVLEYSARGLPLVYKARYRCCYLTFEIRRKIVQYRAKHGTKACRRCASHENMEKGHTAKQAKAKKKYAITADYGVSPPEWPVPNLALVGVHVPFYDRAHLAT